jgi:hypothetical protein
MCFVITYQQKVMDANSGDAAAIRKPLTAPIHAVLISDKMLLLEA